MDRGIYTTVLFVLGLVQPLGDLADARNDAAGLQLAGELLPKRSARAAPTVKSQEMK